MLLDLNSLQLLYVLPLNLLKILYIDLLFVLSLCKKNNQPLKLVLRKKKEQKKLAIKGLEIRHYFLLLFSCSPVVRKVARD